MTDVSPAHESGSGWRRVFGAVPAVIVLVLFAASLVLLRTFPLYVDEPQWKLISSGLFNDNFVMRYFWPACSAGYSLPVPLTWIIPRAIDSILYGDASQFGIIRPIGIATGVGILGSIAVIFHRLARPGVSLLGAATVIVALCSFGVIIPLLVINRPEQSLLVPFLAMMLIYAFRRPDSQGVGLTMSIFWCVVFSLLTSMMLAQHIKSFVLLPAAALAGFVVIRRGWPFVVYLCVSLFAFFETYSLWAKRTDCPELPLLQQALNQLSISPRLLVTSPAEFFGLALHNVSVSWAYLWDGFLAADYRSTWLPNFRNNPFLENFTNAMLLVSAVLLVGFAVWSAFKVIRTSGRASQKLGSPSTVGLAVLAGVALLLPYQTTKNFYETTLIWPLLVLAFALCGERVATLAPRVPQTVLVAASVGVMICQVALLVALQGYQGEWQQRPASDAVALADAREVGQACGLKQDRTQAGLVVDNIAHRAFWMTDKPILADYVIGWWGRGLDIKAAAKTWPITAIVAQCQAIPEEYRGAAKRSADGLYCCAQL